jgi:acyl-CoA dehydrogenase
MLRNSLKTARVARSVASRAYASEATEFTAGPCFGLNDDQRAFQELTRDFTAKEIIPVASHYDKTMEYPWEVIKKAHAAGLG